MLCNNANDSDQMSSIQRLADRDPTYSVKPCCTPYFALVALGGHGDLYDPTQYCFATSVLGVIGL